MSPDASPRCHWLDVTVWQSSWWVIIIDSTEPAVSVPSENKDVKCSGLENSVGHSSGSETTAGMATQMPRVHTCLTGLTLHLFTAWMPDPDFSCSPLGRNNLNERDRDLQRQCKRKRRSRTARGVWKAGESSCFCKTVPVNQPCRPGQIQDAEWSHVPE